MLTQHLTLLSEMSYPPEPQPSVVEVSSVPETQLLCSAVEAIIVALEHQYFAAEISCNLEPQTDFLFYR